MTLLGSPWCLALLLAACPAPVNDDDATADDDDATADDDDATPPLECYTDDPWEDNDFLSEAIDLTVVLGIPALVEGTWTVALEVCAYDRDFFLFTLPAPGTEVFFSADRGDGWDEFQIRAGPSDGTMAVFTNSKDELPADLLVTWDDVGPGGTGYVSFAAPDVRQYGLDYALSITVRPSGG